MQGNLDEEDEDALDDEPFDSSSPARPPIISFTPSEMNRPHNEQKRALREAVDAWALRRGCIVDDSVVVGEVDGVRVSVALYTVTESLATMHAVARMPMDVSVVVEPRTLAHDLRDRITKPFLLGDSVFDRTWHIETSDREAARVLLDESCVVATSELRAIAWCRVVYERGEIEIRLDAERLAGRHLTLAMRLAVALGRRSPQASAYR